MLVEESKYKWSAWLQSVLNTDTDWGVVSASSVHEDAGSDDFAAFRALDGTGDTQWESQDNVIDATFTWVFQRPLRIYRIEFVNKYSGSNMVSKDLIAYADDEMQTEIARGTLEAAGKSVLNFEPEVPVACDRLVLSISTYNRYVGLSDIRIIAEEGILKADLSSFYDTTDGMTCIRNTNNDDGTDTVPGLAGFFFNNVEATNVNVSGNHWIGFGVSAEHLQVLRRDGMCCFLYRQEGMVGEAIHFLKIRWEGYTVYNSRTENSRLIFELFLLENNDMVLNLVQTPTNKGYLGTSALICNGKTTALTLAEGSGVGQIVSFYHKDDKGLTWEVTYANYEESDSYSTRLLLESEGTYYREETIEDEDGNYVEILVPIAFETLSAAMFLKYGFERLPEGKLLIPLVDPAVLYWSSSMEKIENTKAVLKAYPFPQTIHVAADMSNVSIKGIELLSAEYAGHIGVKVSVDNGATYSEEVTIGVWLNTDVNELWESLPENRQLLLDFILYEDARVTRFKITYIN